MYLEPGLTKVSDEMRPIYAANYIEYCKSCKGEDKLAAGGLDSIDIIGEGDRVGLGILLEAVQYSFDAFFVDGVSFNSACALSQERVIVREHPLQYSIINDYHQITCSLILIPSQDRNSRC